MPCLLNLAEYAVERPTGTPADRRDLAVEVEKVTGGRGLLEAQVDDHPEVVTAYDVPGRELPLRANAKRQRPDEREAGLRPDSEEAIAFRLGFDGSADLSGDLPEREAGDAHVRRVMARLKHPADAPIDD